MKFSICIVAYNAQAELERCLGSIHASRIEDYEVIIWDNSPEPLALESHPFQRILRNGSNIGFAAGCNKTAEAANGEYLIFLNPDTMVFGHWAYDMALTLLGDGFEAVGPISNFVAGAQRCDFHGLDIHGNPWALAEQAEACNLAPIETKLLIGFCIMIRAKTWREMEGMDEALFLGNDDLDFSWRMQLAGKKMGIARDVFVWHDGHKSFQSRPNKEVEELLRQSEQHLHQKLLKHYNGNPPSAVELWGVDFFRTAPAKGLSICMIVRDEERNLRELLPTLTWADEVVVVDTGEGTTIASLLGIDPLYLTLKDCTGFVDEGEYKGARVRFFRHYWCDNFAAARNFALKQCTGDWVLWLDADDRVSPEMAKLIRGGLMKKGPTRAYRFRVRSEQAGGESDFLQMRLFPRLPGIEWTGRIHETLEPSIRGAGLQVVNCQNITIEHTGYRDPELNRRKQARNIRMLQQEPADLSTLLLLGNSHASLERWEAALGYYLAAWHHDPGEFAQLRQETKDFLALAIGRSYLQMQALAQAEAWFKQSLHPDASMLLAEIYDATERQWQADKLREEYLEREDHSHPYGSWAKTLRKVAYRAAMRANERRDTELLERFAKEYPEEVATICPPAAGYFRNKVRGIIKEAKERAPDPAKTAYDIGMDLPGTSEFINIQQRVAKALRDVLENGFKGQWTPEQMEAFERLTEEPHMPSAESQAEILPNTVSAMEKAMQAARIRSPAESIVQRLVAASALSLPPNVELML